MNADRAPGGGRASIAEGWTLYIAAVIEAARVRSAEVRPEHLLLGLLAQGGPVAALLGAQGITLAGARQAAMELDDSDMERVGIRLPESLRPAPVLAQRIATGQDLGQVPAFPAVEEMLSTTRSAQPHAVACALLEAEQGVPARILTRLGADIPALRQSLRREPDAMEAPAGRRAHLRTSPERTERYARWGLDRAITVEHFISVPPRDLADLLADPRRLATWAAPEDEIVEILPDGAVWRAGKRAHHLRWRLEETQEPRVRRVLWVCEILSGRHDGETVVVNDLELAPAPGGTMLRLTRGLHPRGPVGAALMALNWRFVRHGMRHTLAYAARAAAEA